MKAAPVSPTIGVAREAACFVRWVRAKPLIPEERTATLVALSDVIRRELRLFDAPMAQGPGFVRLRMIPGPAFDELAEASRATASEPSTVAPTHSMRFASSTESMLVSAVVFWSELGGIQHRWGLEVRMTLRSLPEKIHELLFAGWTALDADRAWFDDDRSRCFAATTLLPAGCLVRSLEGLGDVRWKKADPGFWLLDEASAEPWAAAPVATEAPVVARAQPQRQDAPSYMLSAAELSDQVAAVGSSPDDTMLLPTPPLVEELARSRAGSPPILATMMAIDDIPIRDQLPFDARPSPEPTSSSYPRVASVSRQVQRLESGTVAPSRGRRPSMPFIRRGGEANIAPEQIDLSLFPLERYAEITRALARGEPRVEVLERFRMSDALFTALAEAWLLRFQKEPSLFGRFNELVRALK